MLACVLAFSVPAYAHAQLPEPVTEAFKLLESGEPYKANVSGGFEMKFLGVSLATKLKGTNYTDADGNQEGKLTISVTGPKETKGSPKKISFTTEFKYFPESEEIYFKLGKLPKDATSALEGARSNVWYVGTLADASSITGRSNLAQSHFLAAQAKYPAFTFVEKGSTKKEYTYAYSTDATLLQGFLAEQARLNGTAATGSPVELLDSLKGTLRITKKTMEPRTLTQVIDADPVRIENTVTYTFGASGKVQKPVGATRNDMLMQRFLPQL